MAMFLKRLPLLCQIKTVNLNSFPRLCRYSDNIIDRPDMGPPIPPYKKRQGETINVKKARLLYQSRCVYGPSCLCDCSVTERFPGTSFSKGSASFP